MDLERFIAENRLDFDARTPSDRVWNDIEAALEKAQAPSQPRSKIIWLRNARSLAAAASLLAVGALSGFYFAQNKAQSAQKQVELAQIAPEAAEAEAYFARAISAKTTELNGHRWHSDRVDSDLASIDRAMSELREELAAVEPAERQRLVNALIENYSIKLKILERVLHQIDKKSSAEPLENPSDESSKIKRHEIKNI